MIPHVMRLPSLALLILCAAIASHAQVNVQWQGNTGSWFNSANWSSASVPGASQRAVVTGSQNVTANGNSDASVGAFDLNASGANVVFDFSTSSNVLKLGSYASTWSAGNVEFRNGSGVYGNGSTSTSLAIASGVEFLFGSSSNTTRYLYNLGLTNAGTIRATSNVLSVSNANVTNQAGGLIHADGTEIDFTSTTSLTNLGTIRATGNSGKLYLQGTLTTTALGSVDLVNGGHAYLAGTVNNAAGVLAAPSGGSFELYNGTINGGSLAVGAVKFTSSGGTLNSTLLSGDLALGTNERVNFTGGANFTGSAATLGNSASLYWKQTGSLVGKAISLADGALIYVAGANNALTLDSASSVTGDVELYTDGSAGTAITNLGTITHSSTNSGTLEAPLLTNAGTISNTSANQSLYIGSTYSGYATKNTGTITVNASGASIYLDGDVDNTGGTLNATTGSLILRGNNTAGHVNGGAVNIANGAHVYLNGTVTNSGTFTAPTSGKFELYGGTITGGTIASGALTYTNYGGYLDGATLAEDLTLPASTYVRFKNNAGFSGPNLNLGTSATLYWEQTGSLAGKSVTLGNGSSIYVNGQGHGLTLASNTTVTGDLTIYSDGSTGTAITNQGTLTHTAATSGSIYALSLVNTGTISNTSANNDLYLGSTSAGYTTTNTGTITVNATGANVYLDGDFDNTSGTLNATNGNVVFRGNNTAAHVNGGAVNIANGAHVYLNGTITNSGTFSGPTSGTYELYGGTITGGTIAPGAITFTNYGGYLNSTTLNGDLSLPASSYVHLTGNAAFAGANLNLGANASLYWQQAGTLTGKTITLANGGDIYVAGANNTLTLAANTTATGDLVIYADGSSGTAITNQGALTHTAASSGTLRAPLFTNSGTITNASPNADLYIGSSYSGYVTKNTGNITVNASGANVYLDGDVDNTGGTLNAANGALIFTGNNTAAHVNGGTVNIAGTGHVYLNGTITNSGTFTAPASGMYELYGGKITGGAIAAGAVAFTTYGGYLDAAMLNGDLTLPGSANVRLTGNAAFSGANLNLGASATLYWQQAGTLSGKAISFGNGSEIYISGPNNSLTIASDTSGSGDLQVHTDGSSGTTITNQGTLTHTSGNGGLLSAPLFTNSGSIANTAANGELYIGTTYSGSTRNTGTISVNAANANVYLDGDFDNTGGTLNATNGALIFRGNNTTAHLNGGTVNIGASGHAYLNGTIDNSVSTLNAPSGGAYELYGGTINHGVVNANALHFTSYGGYLNDVTLLGDVTLASGAYARFAAGTNLGTANATLNLGSSAGLEWRQPGTLNGNSVTFGSGAYLYITGSGNSLTLGSSTTATGEIDITGDGTPGTSLTNNGTITHTSGSGNLYSLAFTNAGTINANGGTLYLGTTATGATVANNVGATIRLNGGNVSLQVPAANPVVNNGTIDIVSGTFYTNNHLNNGATGLIRGAGTINGNLTVSGGTIAPGNNGIGTLTINGGTLTIAGAATFDVDLGGTSADKIVFQYPPSTVNIGGGLLSLSLNLLSVPTANTTYNLITISGGSSTISGSFAGLPNSGDTLTALFGGTPFTFSLNYQPNLVSLSYNPVLVPEPSTYALMAAGLIALVAGCRRRRR